MTTRTTLAAMIAAAATLISCGEKRSTTIIVRDGDRGHVCTVDCHHHYYDGRKLVVIKSHRHGPGCGHSWDGRRYVASKRVVVRRGRGPEHVCTPDCSHYYRGGVVVESRGHRHGRGCGHVFDGRRWVARIEKR